MLTNLGSPSENDALHTKKHSMMSQAKNQSYFRVLMKYTTATGQEETIFVDWK